MRERCAVLLKVQSAECGVRSARAILSVLCFLSCLCACPAAEVDETMPAHASGTFVQRKTLADVEVTITSRGTFRFEKGRFFEWNTVEPLPSTFVATPTNYAMTVNGRTTSHRLRSDVTSIAKIFEIKEVKDFVKEVRPEPRTGFPEKLTVDFRNGDRLAIEMKRNL